MKEEEKKMYDKAIYDVMNYLAEDYINHSSQLSRSDEAENEQIYEMIQDIEDNFIKNNPPAGSTQPISEEEWQRRAYGGLQDF